jgi:hypothetical protein
VKSAYAVCPDCDGASADHRLPPCDTCMNQGHLLTNRLPDGSIPATWDDGRPMREWVPLLLPETPVNPLVLTIPRCC